MSSAKMRVLKPKIDEINKKYPKQEDAMKKQQEVMGLYSQYGVSPMGGCLPMLITVPYLDGLVHVRAECYRTASAELLVGRRPFHLRCVHHTSRSIFRSWATTSACSAC